MIEGVVVFLFFTLVIPLAAITTLVFSIFQRVLSKRIAMVLPVVIVLALLIIDAWFIVQQPSGTSAARSIAGILSYPFAIIAPFPLFARHFEFIRHEIVVLVTALIDLSAVFLVLCPRTITVQPSISVRITELFMFMTGIVIAAIVVYALFIVVDASFSQGSENE